MKKTQILFIAAFTLFIISAFSSRQLTDTSLKITVRNDLGNLEQGATIVLYKSKEDYEKGSNAVGTQTTDEKGNAVFKKLEPTVYYINAEKGDKNNFGAAEKTEKLAEGKQNKVTVIISE